MPRSIKARQVVSLASPASRNYLPRFSLTAQGHGFQIVAAMNSGKTVATGPTEFPHANRTKRLKEGPRAYESGVRSGRETSLAGRKTTRLVSCFASRSSSLRSDYPLSDDHIHRVAPTIFADVLYENLLQWNTHFSTCAVLTEPRKEAF
ncbi:hypothetical protein RBI14_21600 [Alcaligenaceae bacterium B3P038]|nr:hypothetical protein [Alcaligenaceae bacterium B3P038]